MFYINIWQCNGAIKLSNVQDNNICSTLMSGNVMELDNYLKYRTKRYVTTLISGTVMELYNYLSYRTTRYVLH